MQLRQARAPDELPLVLVPGFTQRSSSWDGVVAELGELRVRRLEVPTADSFAQTVERLADAGGRGVWVGYSMGGRLALRVAVDRPDIVAALVLVSATPGIPSAEERTARVAHDEGLARDLEVDGVDAFLERWLAQPMFASVPTDAPGLEDRRAFSATELATHLRVLGTGAMAPMWDVLGTLEMPVLVVTGRADEKFEEIGARMTAAIPGARHEHVEAGHAVPLEAPGRLARVLRELHGEITGSPRD